MSVLEYKEKGTPSYGLVEKMASCLFNAGTVTSLECDIIKSKPAPLQKASELLLIVIRKGQRACLQFYEALEKCDPSLYEQITGTLAKVPKNPQNIVQDISSSGGQSPPPLYSISIYHSTLEGCIFGSDSGAHIVRVGTCQDTEDRSFEEDSMSCHRCCHQRVEQSSQHLSTALATQSVQIVNSNVRYAIIGDHSTLTVEEESEDDDV
ncbi:uncharacterized protein LOC136713605 isoform X2 [Amia ocellicauda]|uniref:uncharacterized protein LOC136713605 isoform X2 n=1 Tax=Amia ocellicauda TaxID=2972642 RepID=UPI0034641D20